MFMIVGWDDTKFDKANDIDDDPVPDDDDPKGWFQKPKSWGF